MTRRTIESRLKEALLHDGPMEYGLYEHELKGLLNDLTASLKADKEDFLFAVTHRRAEVAMVLIEKSGQVHINEQAREKLRVLWPAAYESNLQRMIPDFAKQLHAGEIPINGVTTIRE